jgi:hypothetical protein
MTLHRPRSLITIETPIERMFRRIFKRPMMKSERRSLHLKAADANKKSDWHLK